MDGTLLNPQEHVNPRTARVVREVADEVPFVMVTGRPPRWVPRVANELGVAGVTICSNGAVVYDAHSDTVLRSTDIDAARLLEVTERLREVLPGCSFAVERATGGAFDRVDEQFLAMTEFHRMWPNPDMRVVPSHELFDTGAMKLMVLHERLTSGEMAAAANEVVGSELRVTYSTNGGLIELSASGVDKATGLADIAARLGVDRSDVIAFGDMPNDVAMLEWAGHGVAMRNAHLDVAEAADEITAPNSADGVAQVLERWW